MTAGLTTRGSALLTAGLTAAVCGVALGQRDLVRVALLLIAAPAAAASFVSRSRVAISCARDAQPSRVTGGGQVTVRLTLTNQSLLPIGSLMLEDTLGAPFTQRARFTLDSLRGRETRSLAYRLPADHRGRYRVGPLRMRLVDPFGLVERTRSFRAATDFLVLPTVDRLPDGVLPTAWDTDEQAGSHSIGAHGSDDASIREYRHGDDLRKVHWRSSAHTGTIMVRQEERPWHGRTTLLLDLRALAHRAVTVADAHRGDDDPRNASSLEWSVSAAASIAAYLAEHGRALNLLTDVAPARFPGIGALLDHLAAVPASEAGDLSAPLSAISAGGRDSTAIAVFGLLDDTSRELLGRIRRTPGTSLALLVDASSWIEQTANSQRLYAEAVGAAEVALTSAGWRVRRVSHGTDVADAWADLVPGSRLTSPAGAR